MVENETYKCAVDLMLYSPSFDNTQGLEFSNKVLLNKIVLESLIKKNVNFDDGPMIFKLTNDTAFGTYETFIGVHDFTALGNKIYLPSKIAEDLFVERNSIVNISYYLPPKGSFLKLKPKSEAFYDIIDIKNLLETKIKRNYPVIQSESTLLINYNNKDIELEVLECRPFDVISTYNTDIEVDFAPMDKPKVNYNAVVNDVKETFTDNLNKLVQSDCNVNNPKITKKQENMDKPLTIDSSNSLSLEELRAARLRRFG